MNLSENKDINAKLIAGKDYPQTYREFVIMFPNNQSCADYLAKLRWSVGFICPKCNTASIPWNQTHNRFTCSYYRHQTTVTSGTIFAINFYQLYFNAHKGEKIMKAKVTMAEIKRTCLHLDEFTSDIFELDY